MSGFKIFLRFNCCSLLLSSFSLGLPPELDDRDQKFAECIAQEKKWDFDTSACLPGRSWKKLPPEFHDQLKRPLTHREMAEAEAEMGMTSPKTISRRETPQGIIIIGVGGSGKSTISKELARFFKDFNYEDFVQFDGDILRHYHRGYQETLEDDQIGYLDGWEILKSAKSIAITKDALLPKIIEEKRNVIIPADIQGPKYLNRLKENGYEISIVGVKVDYETARLRGLNRAQWTGRAYLGTRKNWEIGVKHMYELAQDPSVARSLIIDNSNFNEPKILFERLDGDNQKEDKGNAVTEEVSPIGRLIRNAQLKLGFGETSEKVNKSLDDLRSLYSDRYESIEKPDDLRTLGKIQFIAQEIKALRMPPKSYSSLNEILVQELTVEQRIGANIETARIYKKVGMQSWASRHCQEQLDNYIEKLGALKNLNDKERASEALEKLDSSMQNTCRTHFKSEALKEALANGQLPLGTASANGLSFPNYKCNPWIPANMRGLERGNEEPMEEDNGNDYCQKQSSVQLPVCFYPAGPALNASNANTLQLGYQ